MAIPVYWKSTNQATDFSYPIVDFSYDAAPTVKKSITPQKANNKQLKLFMSRLVVVIFPK